MNALSKIFPNRTLREKTKLVDLIDPKNEGYLSIQNLFTFIYKDGGNSIEEIMKMIAKQIDGILPIDFIFEANLTPNSLIIR